MPFAQAPHPDEPSTPEYDPLPQEDLATCLRVLETLVSQPDILVRLPDDVRRELTIAAGRLSRPTRLEQQIVSKAVQRLRRQEQRRSDLELRAATAIRDSRHLPPQSEPPRLLLPHVQPEREATAQERQRQQALSSSQSCYICKRDYRELHFFYDSMCPECAGLNYAKRAQTTRLDGKVVLITGSRVKIGFHTSLMMLRAGARVIATTRFPHDAAQRYAREPDYAQWRERLTLYGLDLRHCPSVELFTQHLQETVGSLDILINNAAQTVRRPNGFFAHLQELEQRALHELPESIQPLLRHNHELFASLQAGSATADGRQLPMGAGAERGLAMGPRLGAMTSEYLAVLGFDEEANPAHFPPGHFDADGQQLDLRENNSWRMKAADVTTPELIEVHLVNAIAPFILVSQLKSLMLKSPSRDKHIVNVSAMEGVFARRTKTDRHPHTNMAKASLNMLTRTSAKDFVLDGIHMNSVDTGWVTDEDPFHHSVRKQRTYDFSPPLDAIDGAARVCDPIFTGHITGEHPWGLFFKDYRPSSW
jgi:NAD(P)-dependent dehydrogenase (short-subunit alcohol dehydrogenase family)